MNFLSIKCLHFFYILNRKLWLTGTGVWDCFLCKFRSYHVINTHLVRANDGLIETLQCFLLFWTVCFFIAFAFQRKFISSILFNSLSTERLILNGRYLSCCIFGRERDWVHTAHTKIFDIFSLFNSENVEWTEMPWNWFILLEKSSKSAVTSMWLVSLF